MHVVGGELVQIVSAACNLVNNIKTHLHFVPVSAASFYMFCAQLIQRILPTFSECLNHNFFTNNCFYLKFQR